MSAPQSLINCTLEKDDASTATPYNLHTDPRRPETPQLKKTTNTHTHTHTHTHTQQSSQCGQQKERQSLGKDYKYTWRCAGKVLQRSGLNRERVLLSGWAFIKSSTVQSPAIYPATHYNSYSARLDSFSLLSALTDERSQDVTVNLSCVPDNLKRVSFFTGDLVSRAG